MTPGLVLLLLFVQLANTPPAPLSERGSIAGTVLRLGTREPVEDVRVVLMGNTPDEVPDLSKPAPTFAVSTDAQGKFSFRNVEPGAYRLTLSANGYVRQEYGQRTLPGRGTLINLASGQAMKDLFTEMTPAGSVSGTVRDGDKRPLAGVPVQLMRVGYDQEGDQRLRPSGTTTRTDDRGEFRIYFVTPGRYYLNAGTPQGPPGSGDRSVAANEVQGNYAYVYYPGVAELRFATPVDVQPGAAKTGMDLVLNPIQGVRVSGRIIDSTTGQPPENPKVRLAYRDPGVPWDYDLEGMGRGKVTYKNGIFEFRDVLPGLFAVFASVDEPAVPMPAGTQPVQRRGYLPVEVASADVEGIVVTVSPGTSISGRVRAEGQESMGSAFMPTTAKLGITLTPSSNGAKPSTPGVPAPNYGVLNADGTFRIDNVMPGEFRIELGWLKPQFYVKEARFGVTDILKSPFQYSGRESGTLELVLSPNVASVEGVVTSNRLTGAAGAQVVLVPDQSRYRSELFKTSTTDQNGRFKMPNVPPGDYKLYAWEAIEPFGWFDPDLLRSDEQYAKPVRLTESASQTIDARLIPAR